MGPNLVATRLCEMMSFGEGRRSTRDLQRGGTYYLVLLLSEIARELVWAGGRIVYGTNRGFGDIVASYRLELASRCIVPNGQL